jgi:glycosyltransferase involved in cell wall biosynthesis
MKIGLINNLYKPYQKGGAERIVEILYNELAELGHDVFVISTKAENKSQLEEKNAYYLKSNYSKLNQFSFVYRFFWQITNLVNIKKYQQINKIFKTEKPDLVITNNLMGLGLLTPKAIKKSGAHHLHVIHDIQLLHPSGLMYYGQEKIIKSIFAKTYQKITKKLIGNPLVISPSRWLLELHQSCGLFKNSETQIINNPFVYKNNVTKKTSNNFIFIGQLEKHKGVDLFIDAAKRFLNYNFIVVGDGSLKEKITETKNLKVVGKKNPEEVIKLLRESAAIIVPSRCYENSPTVIYEAASTGTTAIAANLGGIPELIERFGGLLFEPDNLDSLILSIEEFLEKEITVKLLKEEDSYAQKIISLL